MMNRSLAWIVLGALVTGCATAENSADNFTVEGSANTVLHAQAFDAFDSPWAMTFLPDGKILVTEKTGALLLVSSEGRTLGRIDGVPATRAQGQGGLGDIVLHPDFTTNNLVYLSYVERDAGLSGAVVIRAVLELDGNGGTLSGRERIWEQRPKVTGNGHYSHRLVFDRDGMLFITSGDRQKLDPAQDLSVSLGKIIRLYDDGTIPADNPFASHGSVAREFWTTGHRNPLGIAFAADGTLWANEMGPRGGDELNRIEPGNNYGWPKVSDGVHYSLLPIPDHDTDPSFAAPVISWVPSISPAGLVIYSGTLFPGWQGHALMGGLSGEALIRVALDNGQAAAVERYSWDRRVREVEQGPDGAIWVLEDESGGRLIRFTPCSAAADGCQ